MSDGREIIEAAGETVGEAKWAAVRELEQRFPGLDRDAVEFEVLSEGERGLMGVGREPARVRAELTRLPAPGAAPRPPDVEPTARRAESDGEAAVREVVETVAAAIGVSATVRMSADGDNVQAAVSGSDLGPLIGRHGHTIDALQFLAGAIAQRRTGRRIDVVVDAQNYRKRREAALHEAADHAVEQAQRTGEPVSMEPMTSVERKAVHLHLAEHPLVVTESAGREPQRYVVVRLRD